MFAELFDRHYHAVAGFLRRRLDPALADELASETFLQAFSARDRYDLGRADARPWLYGIASNLLGRHRRTEERRLRAYARAAVLNHEDAGFDALDARLDAIDDGPALARALGSLRPGERDVLLLHAWAELTYEQIAFALDVPVGTVRSRLHHARKVLRELFERNREEGDDTLAGAIAPTRKERQ